MIKSFVKNFFLRIYPTMIVIGVIELSLRVFLSAPSGYFNFLLPTSRGLYPPNAVIYNYWGKIPYTVRTNSHGLRGGELFPPGRQRIIAIGDSITDGMFVDNEDTYPNNLQKLLDDRARGRFEVINAARGGATINRELAVLKKVALPLFPKVVILNFSNNDIFEMSKLNSKELFGSNVAFQDVSRKNRMLIWLATKTAIGEQLLKFYHQNFVVGKLKPIDMSSFKMDTKYEGDGKISENLAIHDRYYKSTTEMILNEPWPENTEGIVRNYLAALNEFNRICLDNNIRLLVAYVPSYTQLFRSDASIRIKNVINDECARLSINFLDLTPVLSSEARMKKIHLAPLDFHFNPYGNRIIAGAILEFMASRKMIDIQ